MVTVADVAEGMDIGDIKLIVLKKNASDNYSWHATKIAETLSSKGIIVHLLKTNTEHVVQRMLNMSREEIQHYRQSSS